MEFSKIEALKYLCSNYKGKEGVHQVRYFTRIISGSKELYSKDELDSFINEMNLY